MKFVSTDFWLERLPGISSPFIKKRFLVRCVTRNIGGFCTSCGSTKLFHKTSTSGLGFVFRSTKKLWWISLLSRLKAVCGYASHSAFDTVLAFITLSEVTPSQSSVKTARHVERSANLWFTELAPLGGFCVFVCLQAYFLPHHHTSSSRIQLWKSTWSAARTLNVTAGRVIQWVV